MKRSPLLFLLGLAACGSFGAGPTTESDGGVVSNPPTGPTADGGAETGTSTTPARTVGLAMGRTELANPGITVHACLLDDGAVRCWGNDHFGQAPSNAVVKDAVQLAAGDDHTCARLKDNTLKCWGYNFHGALGVTAGEGAGSKNGVVTPGIGDVLQVSAGYGHTCAVREGRADCWGKISDSERPGAPATGTQSKPARVADGVMQVSAGYKSTCILTSGVVKCVGANDFGQAGLPASGNARVANFQLVSPLVGATAVVAGRGVACALAGKAASCWGNGGAFGKGAVSLDKPASLGSESYVAIAAGDRVCAIRDGGHDVDCWVGSSKETEHFEQDEVVRVATALTTNCAVSKTGKLLCWGDLRPFGGTSSADPVEIPH